MGKFLFFYYMGAAHLLIRFGLVWGFGEILGLMCELVGFCGYDLDFGAGAQLDDLPLL